MTATIIQPEIPKIQVEEVKHDPEIDMMEQILEGVMFHTFYVDLYELLDLQGFKKLHTYQKNEEEKKLNMMKKEYIKNHCKIPLLHIPKVKYWSENSGLSSNDMSDEDKAKIAIKALKDYCDWESDALESFVSWKQYDMAKDVMKEIDRIKYIMNIIQGNDNQYEIVKYVSNNI